ncbi:MAG TPA: tetratricopeptide repeat protein [Candidatus Eisenbacteria bacterium]|nr:tetratricopeptide repeat protein [Candidatus Eisenbacteria bacterium]
MKWKMVLGAALAVGLGASETQAQQDLLSPTRARMEALKGDLSRAGSPPEKARLLLLTGRHEDALRVLPELPESARVLRGQVLIANAKFQDARALMNDVVQKDMKNPEARSLVYRWWVMVDDLGGMQSAAERWSEPVDLRARGEVAALTLNFGKAHDLYRQALARSRTAADSADAREGLGVVAYRRQYFEASLEDLTQALSASDPDPDLLLHLADTLIRLGRTAEAIAAARLAVSIAPYHEAAHYLLGNGYTEQNYTELLAKRSAAFADAAGRKSLALGDSLLDAGHVVDAERAYASLAALHSGWADVRVRLGSLEFSRSDYAEARRWFGEALALCPEYGRAHNGMAKALEAERLAIEVHRANYERLFAATPTPHVPEIERFVLNWSALSPRHQKQVALSIAPWGRFVPVLVSSGATYYIKPLYQLLSETPGQELLRDQRISYDSRLWDDVRGCGGFHTVTGIEDVERTVLNRYNTVLHELTHQVHAVLTADRKRSIQELYRRAKERDEENKDSFLSRYAGGSVWEYFAEGANALESPRRDGFDTREVVRERLEKKDPTLKALVEELMLRAVVDSSYAVGFANQGDDLLERGKARDAIAAYQRALARSPQDEIALGSLVYALEVADSAESALRRAEREAKQNPTSANLCIRYAYTQWEGGRGLDAAIRTLAEGRDRVREEERYLIDLELGRLWWIAGSPESSKKAFASVLDYQSDNPEGLWGLASAEALASKWDDAFARFEEAVRHRTGVVELRAAYARELLRAGRLEPAEEQIQAAMLLDPEDPQVLALRGWLLWEKGNATEAREAVTRSLELAPWCDLALIVRARIESAEGDHAAAQATLTPIRARIEGKASPIYVYRPKWGRYDLVHTLPEVERKLIPGS